MGIAERAWEYRVVVALKDEGLNELGSDGWELVGVSGDSFVFKRPGLSFKERVTLDQKQRYYALLNVLSETAVEEELP
jgi:hypothetical protein